MGYLFLTGATGLLGTYLMRDLLQAGTKLAVLVRSTKWATARQRVETQLDYWEKKAGHSLPRPVVLEGDISRSDLGLDAATRAWVAENCTAFMHNAASLTFHAEGREDEPWKSNLDGTRNVLDFCRETGIREFHHVSTAYVCGLRRDLILESELDVGQTHGNDYEVSKCKAEKLVRAAEFLDNPTIYRPAIIIGDAQTGYTTTFHGFYVPLKLLSTLLEGAAAIAGSREELTAGVRLAAERLKELLALDGTESKNYVPVDWVSAVMAAIYTNRDLHGQTYHLTPRERTPVSLMQEVMSETFITYAELKKDSKPTVDWFEFEDMFLKGMQVYRSYWKDDPAFDSTNTQKAVPHLPCPPADADMLRKMCRYAMEANFGWPRTPIAKPELDVDQRLKGIGNGATEDIGLAFVGLQVTGPGGGEWRLALRQGRVVAADQGLSSRCSATYYLNATTLRQLARRETAVTDAINCGRVLIEGNGVPMDELTRALQHVAEQAGQT